MEFDLRSSQGQMSLASPSSQGTESFSYGNPSSIHGGYGLRSMSGAIMEENNAEANEQGRVTTQLEELLNKLRIGMEDTEFEGLMVDAEDLVQQNKRLIFENENLYNYFQRMMSNQDTTISMTETHSTATENKKGKKRQGRSARPRMQVMSLSIDQKLKIAESEESEIQRLIKFTEEDGQKAINTLQVAIEETRARMTDYRKDAYEFKRAVVVGGENPRSGKPMAERVLKYMEDHLREQDSQVERMHLKNATLRRQIQKITQQLTQKEQMGDALKYIDYTQLQIENKQFMSSIDELNDDLLELKKTTGRTVQNLNHKKTELSTLLTESDKLRQDAQSRHELITKICEETEQVRAVIRQARAARRKLRAEQAASEALPQVMDYVRQRADMYEINKAIQSWERKIEIVEMATKRQQTLMGSTKHSRRK